LDSPDLAPRKDAREHRGVVIKAVQIVSPAAEFFNLERSLGTNLVTQIFPLLGIKRNGEKSRKARARRGSFFPFATAEPPPRLGYKIARNSLLQRAKEGIRMVCVCWVVERVSLCSVPLF
jgi:hypothetical protein